MMPGKPTPAMSSGLSIPINQLLDTTSPHYTQPWPDVTVLTMDVMQLVYPQLQHGKGPAFIIANAPPFKFKLNCSRREVRHDGELYLGGELAFHRDGLKVAAISWMAGPHGVLNMWIDGELASETHRLEKGRQLEDEIIEALCKEAKRLKDQRK